MSRKTAGVHLAAEVGTLLLGEMLSVLNTILDRVVE
jgi:hypothetical protein